MEEVRAVGNRRSKMDDNYLYAPEGFAGVLGLPEDLSALYGLHKKYVDESSQENWHRLINHWEILFFTIKHRALEGAITQNTAQELREYLEGIIYG